MPEIEKPLLTIFSQPSCVQCVAAERHAISKKIPYQKIDVTQNPEAYDLVTTEWGYMRAPVLYFDGKHAGGFDPNFLSEVEEALVAVAA
jgi:glutaredoxin-like protein NrdH